jgi:archaellum component FlaC
MNAPSPEEMNARFETFTSRVEDRMQTVVDMLIDERKLNTERVHQMDQRFDQMGRRFDQVDQRFDQVDQRFDQVDKKFVQVDLRLERIDGRFEVVDARFEGIDKRFELFDKRLERLETLVDRLHAIALKLPLTIVGAIVTTVAIMTFVLNYATPLALLRNHVSTLAKPAAISLADAETAKDNTKQVVRREGASDRR